MSTCNRRLEAVCGNDDRGATAILFALVAALLFGVAALAVEATNLYARDRASQTTADLAALAGAQYLPNTCQAFSVALETLNQPENGVANDGGTPLFGASASVMSDGSLSNGEIQVLRRWTGVGPVPATILSASSCSSAPPSGPSPITADGEARALRITTPPRKVAFSFTSTFALSGNAVSNNALVQAVATAAISAPAGARTLPVYLPGNCNVGPNTLLTTTSSGTLSNNNYSPAGSNSPGAPSVLSVSPPTSPSGSAGPIVVQIANLTANPTTSAVAFDFTLFTFAADGTATRSAVVNAVAPTRVSQTGTGPYGATFSISVPGAVSSSPGTWRIRASQGPPARWTPSDRVGTLTIGTVASAGCGNPSTGSFGSLDSPRLNENDKILERNLAGGLDHGLVTNPRTPSPVDDQCSTSAPDVRDNVSLDGRNCLNSGSGLSAGQLTGGLISGGNGFTGRLNTGGSTPPGLTPTNCSDPDGSGDFQWRTPIGPGQQFVLNTVLSCYLAPTRTLQDVQNGVAESLRVDIYKDPRFFFLPTLHTADRPPNGFYPIRNFRAAFITSESVGNAAACSANACNGLEFQGNQVRSVQTFVFPTSALPAVVSQSGNGDTYVAGTKDVLLVE